MFSINTTDPSRNSYYYPILAGIFLFLIIMELLISVLKDKVDFKFLNEQYLSPKCILLDDIHKEQERSQSTLPDSIYPD